MVFPRRLSDRSVGVSATWILVGFRHSWRGIMLFGGANSDLQGDRALHCIVPCCVMAPAIIQFRAAVWLVVASLAVSFVCIHAAAGAAGVHAIHDGARRRAQVIGAMNNNHVQRICWTITGWA